MCADGYYGDPEGRYGPRRPCQRCSCNDNIDPNAVGNCNSTTGECLKCIYNSGGRFCESCLRGYYGNALSLPKGQCVACDCYRPGTIHRPTEDVISCHSQTGQCSCQPNVDGRKCDTCLDGYWRIDSATVLRCEPCFCDRVGAHNTTCDIRNGQCYCKDGVTGRTCGKCEQYYYGFSWDGCKGCECDPEGSLDLQCDETRGTCPCKPNVEGRQCDRCMENKFNITAGCVDCPACYTLVQDRITIHRHKVNELRELIQNIGKNPGQINDTDFRRRMNEVNETVVELVNDARKAVGSDGPLGDQLQELKDAIKKLMMECGRIHDELGDARAASDNALTDISAAERAIEEAETALREAEKYIEMEGQDALRKAKEAQERFGQQSQRMTEIAKQAREEAERQEEEATRIEETAKRALNTSQEAWKLAQNALQKPHDTQLEIQQLERDVTDAEHLYEQTKEMAERAKQQALDAYADALKIFSQAKSLAKPELNVAQLRGEATSIKEESRRIKEEADRLIDQHRDLMEDVERQKQEAENMLENGIRQQQIADELLADADYARDVARKALSKAEMTLRDANDTLRTLKEFDEKVQDSKLQAAKALDKIPAIEDEIVEAERKTQEARTNLAGAEADAISARDIAQQAQGVADMASEEAGDIRAEADTTKREASDLRNNVDEIARDVKDAERRLENYENQADEDQRLADEALSKADGAKTSAKASSDLVSGGLDTVNDILILLDGLEEIDSKKLDELEDSMMAAERQINETQLEERYTMLINARNQHQQWINMFTDELIQLKADVNNVEQINKTIPRTCFKRVDLEPTGPTG